MRDNKYNTWQECKKCGSDFLKTAATGNQCDTCRRGQKKRTRYNRNTKIKEHTAEPAIKFIDKIEKRDGYIYSLIEMSELLEHWYNIASVQYKYDKLPAGHQLHYMWRDLLEFKYKYLSKKTGLKIEKNEF